ncbi:unnamed protein product [Owenia fusiformis]|uniref:Uncharacterized protein n=1 Tax=Owenia fusiformis TaxID=6347 RepID=A0A8J1TGK2_OWEFU|nr:unnamed protein product [Owenia fusiformis]
MITTINHEVGSLLKSSLRWINHLKHLTLVVEVTTPFISDMPSLVYPRRQCHIKEVLLLISLVLISQAVGQDCQDFHDYSKNETECGKCERYQWISSPKGNKKEPYCLQCPITCGLGRGLNRECGLGQGEGAICIDCDPLKHFYSDESAPKKCKLSIRCESVNRGYKKRATRKSKAICDECLPGYVPSVFPDEIECEPCSIRPEHPNCTTTTTTTDMPKSTSSVTPLLIFPSVDTPSVTPNMKSTSPIPQENKKSVFENNPVLAWMKNHLGATIMIGIVVGLLAGGGSVAFIIYYFCCVRRRQENQDKDIEKGLEQSDSRTSQEEESGYEGSLDRNDETKTPLLSSEHVEQQKQNEERQRHPSIHSRLIDVVECPECHSRDCHTDKCTRSSRRSTLDKDHAALIRHESYESNVESHDVFEEPSTLIMMNEYKPIDSKPKSDDIELKEFKTPKRGRRDSVQSDIMLKQDAAGNGERDIPEEVKRVVQEEAKIQIERELSLKATGEICGVSISSFGTAPPTSDFNPSGQSFSEGSRAVELSSLPSLGQSSNLAPEESQNTDDGQHLSLQDQPVSNSTLFQTSVNNDSNVTSYMKRMVDNHDGTKEIERKNSLPNISVQTVGLQTASKDLQIKKSAQSSHPSHQAKGLVTQHQNAEKIVNNFNTQHKIDNPPLDNKRNGWDQVQYRVALQKLTTKTQRLVSLSIDENTELCKVLNIEDQYIRLAERFFHDAKITFHKDNAKEKCKDLFEKLIYEKDLLLMDLLKELDKIDAIYARNLLVKIVLKMEGLKRVKSEPCLVSDRASL